MKNRKKRKHHGNRTPSRFRVILTTAGILFVSFNIFLITRIKSDASNAQLPHHEIDYKKIQDFSIDVNQRIRGIKYKKETNLKNRKQKNRENRQKETKNKTNGILFLNPKKRMHFLQNGTILESRKWDTVFRLD